MVRALPELASHPFDVAIIGGGITGCCIARDAARRGLRVALVERGDFSSGTSAATSKLVHGGLRYLRQFQLGVVRESLRERRVWGEIAPHTVRRLTFLLPIAGRTSDLVMRAGMRLYDLLAWDRNRGVPAGRRVPASQHLEAGALTTLEPVLRGNRPWSGFAYSDYHSRSPERLAIACLADAVAHGATCANYVEAARLERGHPHVLHVRDRLGGDAFAIRATLVVNATGPWSDDVASRIGAAGALRITRSKGIHVVTRPLTGDHALLVPVAGRHFFVIPWEGASLIGTTDTPYDGSPDDVGVSEGDIEDFLRRVNAGLPEAGLTRADVRYAYAGLRPLVGDGAVSTYRASRRSDIRDHGDGVLSVIGGKWTTSRAVAEACVDRIAARLGRALAPCDTARAPLADFTPDESPGALPETLRRAIRSEMAMTLADLVFRRTNCGTRSVPDRASLEEWASTAASALGWSDADRARQVGDVIAAYARVSMRPA